jgi:hypothetical protein
MPKQCSQCKIVKVESDFYKDKRRKSGLYSACKECHLGKHRKYRQEYMRKYYRSSKNKDYRKSSGYKKGQKKCQEKYRDTEQYKERKRKYMKNVWLKNPKNQLDSNMRNLIWLAIKGEKAGRSWKKLVGYTIKDLMKHLERQFDDKMSWNNYGSYWWLDHIKPRSLFKYENAEDPEFRKCWALENLQPMEKIANIKKGNKF